MEIYKLFFDNSKLDSRKMGQYAIETIYNEKDEKYEDEK
jgi:hypothetical protein